MKIRKKNREKTIVYSNLSIIINYYYYILSEMIDISEKKTEIQKERKKKRNKNKKWKK